MTNLQDFIDTGMQFFGGESSYKAKLEAAETEIAALKARIAETSSINEQLVAASKNVVDQATELARLQTELTASKAEVATLTQQIATLKADLQPGRQAARILASAGVDPVPTTVSTNETKDFASLVAAQIASGKSKSAAISAVITANPEAYREWRKTGGSI